MPAEQDPTVAVREARVRRALAKDGHALRKDRAHSWSVDRQGGYMIVDPNRNWIIAGSRYDFTLEDVEAWVEEGAAA